MRSSIIVQNLKCGGCAKTIISRLNELSGIENTSVNLETSMVSFESIEEDRAFEVKRTLKMIGYPSIDEENTVLSKAKSMVSCASGRISKK